MHYCLVSQSVVNNCWILCTVKARKVNRNIQERNLSGFVTIPSLNYDGRKLWNDHSENAHSCWMNTCYVHCLLRYFQGAVNSSSNLQVQLERIVKLRCNLEKVSLGLIKRSISQSIKQSVGRSVSQSVNQSVRQWLCQNL